MVKRGIPVRFALDVNIAAPAPKVFQALVDWKGHESWIPLTKVRIGVGSAEVAREPHVGQHFMARTGIGRLAFDDNMAVVQLDPESRKCEVIKTGPLLTGRAGFEVREGGAISVLSWYEEVSAPLPSFLSPILSPLLTLLGRIGFQLSLRRLGALLREK
jgi:hypothetical protein